MITIIPAGTGDPLNHMIALAHEYVTWMTAEIQQQYADLDIAGFTAEHAYDDIAKKFPGEHVPPDGFLYVAMDGQEAAGCVALGRLSETIGEMRTLYVRPAFRGLGVGRQLVAHSLEEARKLKYERIRLDTLSFMEDAQRLYQRFGFYPIAPYREMPIQYTRFFEAKL